MRRVVITGMGVVSPLGCDKDTFWKALETSASGSGNITRFDATDYECQIAAEVKDFDPESYGMTKKEIKRLDLFSQYALAATHQAIQDAGLELAEKNPHIGVIVGSGVGGITTIEKEKERLQKRQLKGKKGPSFISPLFVPIIMPNAASGNISIKYKLNSSSMSTASACATGLHSIIYGAKDIMIGDAEVMAAGGAEAGITPLGMGSFANMNAMSKAFNDAPDKASRPFDRDRSGFVMGEGAGVVILESLDHALDRGAKIYAELVGYGLSSDAYHITAPAPDSYEIARAMQMALDKAGMEPEDVDYINAHGTSTPDNDLSETNAIKKVFGNYAYKLKISSTKSMTGHLIGGAGAVETLACVLAIENQIIPPTINYETPDPECDLYYVPNKAESSHIATAMNNSFGFGGHNAVIIVKAYEKGAA